MRRIISIVLLAMCFLLFACNKAVTKDDVAKKEEPIPTKTQTQSSEDNKPEEPLDLTGGWEEEQKGEVYFAASVAYGVIEVFLMSQEGVPALYWAGTYEEPKEAAEQYAWTSKNIASRTQGQKYADNGEEKTFTYKDGQLICEASLNGKKAVISLKRAETEYFLLRSLTANRDPKTYKKLKLLESGYTLVEKAGYYEIYCALKIQNPNEELAVEHPTVMIRAKNKSCETQEIGWISAAGIAANDTVIYAYSMMNEGQPPSEVNFYLEEVYDFMYTPQIGSGITRSDEFSVTYEEKEEADARVISGQVLNTTKYDYEYAQVYVMFKNGGKTVGGDVQYIEKLPAREARDFKITVYDKELKYDAIEICAVS